MTLKLHRLCYSYLLLVPRYDDMHLAMGGPPVLTAVDCC